MSIDIASLRKLLTDYEAGRMHNPVNREAARMEAWAALSELLDEVERLRIEVGELEDSRAKERDESVEVVKAQRERIAQLEAALREMKSYLEPEQQQRIDAILEGKE